MCKYPKLCPICNSEIVWACRDDNNLRNTTSPYFIMCSGNYKHYRKTIDFNITKRYKQLVSQNNNDCKIQDIRERLMEEDD